MTLPLWTVGALGAALLLPACGSAAKSDAQARAAAADSVGGDCPADSPALREALGGSTQTAPVGLELPGEVHLRNLRQLSFGGQNAEAYWSWDGRDLILQVTDEQNECDQIHVLDVASGRRQRITSGGRTTCAFFMPGDQRVLFASTHEAAAGCPAEPDRSQGYVWPLFEYDIYTANRDGSGLRNVTAHPGYDAEATVAPDGTIVFTSTRSGDLELWTMNPDGGELRQITHTPGYDGGAVFSPDGRRLAWRASRPATPAALEEDRALLARGLVRPSQLELWVANVDGSQATQLTNNGKANFAPCFTPDGEALIFASNMADPKGRAFELWLVRLDGGGLERVTHDPSGFNGFPMFSRDGRRLAISSNRNGSVPHETNVFVADWVP
ncbi:MAG: TolB family protein [Planctomycetota bacterium]